MKLLKDKKIIIYKGEAKIGVEPGSNYRPIHPGKLWAYVRQISSKEYYLMSATEVEEEIMFAINWRSGFTALSSKGLYVVYGGNWYNITRVDTYEGYKDTLKLYGKTTAAPSDSNILEYEG